MNWYICICKQYLFVEDYIHEKHVCFSAQKITRRVFIGYVIRQAQRWHKIFVIILLQTLHNISNLRKKYSSNLSFR